MPEGVASLTAAKLPALGDAYVARVSAPPPGASRWVDKLTGNFANAGLIRLILPEARIIHSRRDPVDSCLSCYTKNFDSPGLGFAYDMTELDAMPRLSRADGPLAIRVARDPFPRSGLRSRGRRFLEREARRMLDFLGLPWDPACLEFHRAERPVHTASVNQVRKPIYLASVGRWRAHAEQLAPLLQALGVEA